MAKRPRAPWRDFAGKRIYAGETLLHPLGDVGKVVWMSPYDDPARQWKVDYGEGAVLSLFLQIGDRGQARVIK